MVEFIFKCIWYSINRKDSKTSILLNVYFVFSMILFLLASAGFMLLNIFFGTEFPIKAEYFEPHNRLWMLIVVVIVVAFFYFLAHLIINISLDAKMMEKELVKGEFQQKYYRRFGFIIIIFLTFGTYILSSFMSNGINGSK